MPKIVGKPLTKLHIPFFTEDVKLLRELYAKDPGVSEIIRETVHRFCVQAGYELRKKIDEMERS
jgi:hypothetical protein